MTDRWRKAAVACILPILAGGCWFEAAAPVRYYDLAPVTLQEPAQHPPVMISEFENFSPSGSRIMVRYPDGSMREVPDCKWIQGPGELVSRRLIAALAAADSGAAAPVIHVRGRITEFTVNHADQMFEFDGFYILQAPDDQGLRRDFRIRKPIVEADESGWVEAASAAVAELAGMLNADLPAVGSR